MSAGIDSGSDQARTIVDVLASRFFAAFGRDDDADSRRGTTQTWIKARRLAWQSIT